MPGLARDFSASVVCGNVKYNIECGERLIFDSETGNFKQLYMYMHVGSLALAATTNTPALNMDFCDLNAVRFNAIECMIQRLLKFECRIV